MAKAALIPTKKEARPVDRIIGSNVRKIRLMRGMSQEKLGDALGLTFQQVQKYEKGSNRIGGSRMVQICDALRCSHTDLFAGTQGGNGKTTPFNDPAVQLLQSDRGIRLARAFLKLKPTHQATVLALCEELVG